jgi:uncharacterized membrane protein YkvA (DUF1232 family)
MTNDKPVPVDPDRNLSFMMGILKQLRLVWLLFRDGRVPIWVKSVLPISLVYLISPVDFVPDVILGLGQLDDLGIILLGIALFVRLCPPDIVDYYRNQLEYGNDFEPDNDETVDTTYRVVDED